MDYTETLAYMYSQLPMYQRQGATAFKKDLGNIIILTRHLGEPHKHFKSIHIAGTNGKGTVAHIIAACLQAHGYKVGMYTSPHYIDFRERIKINGNFVSEQFVIDFIEKNKLMLQEVNPSFFEMTVGMAFQYFAQEQVDIAIIETGLGGRLDSTNIITPELSVITNISLDHQSMLGDTLSKIAAEKAGIIKVKIPVVIGETQREVKDVFRNKAKEARSKIDFADQLLSIRKNADTIEVAYKGDTWLENVKVKLQSDVQSKNLVTALAAIKMLSSKWRLNREQIKDGLENIAEMTYYVGRYQVLQHRPLVLADSAHNIAGVNELMKYIKKEAHQHLHIVLGMVNDKDIEDVLSLLPRTAAYYFTKANIPRGLASDILKVEAAKHNLHGRTYESVDKAYHAALAKAGTEDMIVVLGSIFVVAEVLAI